MMGVFFARCGWEENLVVYLTCAGFDTCIVVSRACLKVQGLDLELLRRWFVVFLGFSY